MLILFFTIVFIAELIVAGKVISILKQASSSLNEINVQIDEAKSAITKGVVAAKNGVATVTKGVSGFSAFLAGKQKEVFKYLVKGIIAIVLLVFLRKLPHKKVLSVVDVLFAIGNLLKIA